MKKILLIAVLLSGCVSLRNRPVTQDLNIVGNPLIRCSTNFEGVKVEIEGRFVCRTTTEKGVIKPCHVDNPKWVGRIVLEDRGRYWTIWEPENSTCYFTES